MGKPPSPNSRSSNLAPPIKWGKKNTPRSWPKKPGKTTNQPEIENPQQHKQLLNFLNTQFYGEKSREQYSNDDLIQSLVLESRHSGKIAAAIIAQYSPIDAALLGWELRLSTPNIFAILEFDKSPDLSKFHHLLSSFADTQPKHSTDQES